MIALPCWIYRWLRVTDKTVEEGREQQSRNTVIGEGKKENQMHLTRRQGTG